MKNREYFLRVASLVAAVTVSPAGSWAQEDKVHAGTPKLPLVFEANLGQTDKQVKFLARGDGYELFLTVTEAVLVLNRSEGKESSKEPDQRQASVLRMNLVGANRNAHVTGQDELSAKANYFIGNDAGRWRRNVPTYGRVRYEAVYPGVDLVYYGKQRQLEYDFIVAPGANPDVITLGFQGAGKVELNPRGEVVLHTPGGAVGVHKPLVYQERDGMREEIPGSYTLKDNQQVGFKIAAYDSTRPLIIDPVLVYSSFLGGSAAEQGIDIAVDAAGAIFVTGITGSADFPVAGTPLRATPAGLEDVFVAKIDSTGALVYSTYLGGTGSDLAREIAVDAAGNAYVTGSTRSLDFPTVNAFQAAHRGGGQDVFATKLDANGSALVYSTYLGGSGADICLAVAVDPLGHAFVTGHTGSLDFPVVNAVQPVFAGGGFLLVTDLFVTKFDPSGSSLVYSTYLGGSDDEEAGGVAADGDGNAYVTGRTCSTDFPTQGPIQPAGGFCDAIVAKLDANGTRLVYSTYLGGQSTERALDIALDSERNVYVTGHTGSTDFPLAGNPAQATKPGDLDVFVTKLDASGTALVYSTYLGGTDSDTGWGIAVNASGEAHVTGVTRSLNFPAVAPLQSVYAGGVSDVFITKLSAAGDRFVYSTYLGGSDQDRALGIAADNKGNAYVIGDTFSADFPTENARQPGINGITDAWLAVIADATPVGIDIKPREAPNSINPAGDEVIAVAILSSLTRLAPVDIDRDSLTFGRTGDEASLRACNLLPEDVDLDGLLDLLCDFAVPTAGFRAGDTQGLLKGETIRGERLLGKDSVVVVAE